MNGSGEVDQDLLALTPVTLVDNFTDSLDENASVLWNNETTVSRSFGPSYTFRYVVHFFFQNRATG